MKKEFLATIGAVLAVCVIVFFGCTPAGIAIRNTWGFANQKVDDMTNYETIKKVEDTCRSMIASYEADLLTYEQYKDSEDEEKQSWAENAKMRANKTASSYNNYITKNSFVWKDNIPTDIRGKLDYID